MCLPFEMHIYFIYKLISFSLIQTKNVYIGLYFQVYTFIFQCVKQ